MEAYADPATHYIDGLTTANAPWVLAGAVLLLALAALCLFMWRWLKVRERQIDHQMRIDEAREARKLAEEQSREQRDRERSEMEGRWVEQIERNNVLIEGIRALMEAMRASNDALHADFAESRKRSGEMGENISHIRDRVDLMYERKE